jgi:hypothetical protein
MDMGDDDRERVWTDQDLPRLLEIGEVCAQLLQAMRRAPSMRESSSAAEDAIPSDIESLIDRILTEPDDSSVCSRLLLRFSQTFFFCVDDGRRLSDE